MVSCAEGMLLGKSLGIDQKKLQQIIEVSTASNWYTNEYNPAPGVTATSPGSNDYKGGWHVALAVKDFNIALDLADETNCNMDTTRHCIKYFEDLVEDGQGGRDWGCV